MGRHLPWHGVPPEPARRWSAAPPTPLHGAQPVRYNHFAASKSLAVNRRTPTFPVFVVVAYVTSFCFGENDQLEPSGLLSRSSAWPDAPRDGASAECCSRRPLVGVLGAVVRSDAPLTFLVVADRGDRPNLRRRKKTNWPSRIGGVPL